MRYNQPRFNAAPSFNFGAPAKQPEPIVEPCAGGCGEANPNFGISTPGPNLTDRKFYCLPCWLLQPTTQSSMMHRLRDALEED